ncbi:hypothetical protein [uncultured Sphaerotilus sp.]|uniref:hypothetical protein n=1 Tax=uncultured Sphaerotilus sp. TaxID=474984 RepID=UPI0030CA2E19
MLRIDLGQSQLDMLGLGGHQIEQRTPPQTRPLLVGGRADLFAVLEHLDDLPGPGARAAGGVVERGRGAGAFLDQRIFLAPGRERPFGRGVAAGSGGATIGEREVQGQAGVPVGRVEAGGPALARTHLPAHLR